MIDAPETGEFVRHDSLFSDYSGARAFFDHGGWARPGFNVIYNATGKVEHLTNDTSAASGGPHYHLHIHTSAQTEPIIQDFRMMETIFSRNT